MVSAPPSGFPEDWEEIVRRIAKQIVRKQFPFIRTRLVSYRSDEEPEKWDLMRERVRRRQLADDLVDEALTHIWMKREFFNPQIATFHAWCYAVLGNFAIDLIRKRRRRLKIDGQTGEPWEETEEGEIPSPILEAEDPHWAKEQQTTIWRIDRLDQFPQEDLQSLEDKLPPKRRVLALAVMVGDLWRKVPPEVWSKWLEEAEIDPPFPPEEADPEDDLESLEGRARWIAKALGMHPEAVKQHFYRSRKVLQELRYIKRLREDFS